MIADFERRFAEVLGGRLPAPFGGQVMVAPGDGAGAAVLVAARTAALLDEEFGARPERVPGADDVRRVVRLSCTVGLTVRAAAAGGRAQQIAGVDDLLYAVDAPDLRDGSALRPADGDPGFLIDAMRLADSNLAVDGADAMVSVVARGWFWPKGAPGETGVRVGEIRVRGLVYPIVLAPPPSPVAGGPAIGLTMRIRPVETSRLGGAPAPVLPFGHLAVKLLGPGDRPPTGAIAGGDPGSDGSRLLAVVDGAATLSYTPPATPASEQLVVALDDGAGGLGLELARLPIRVRRG